MRWRSADAPFGVAFQLREEMRQVWGSGGETPAPDVLNKKKLIPIVYAFEKANITTKRRLGDIYFKRVLEQQDVPAVLAVLDELGARELLRDARRGQRLRRDGGRVPRSSRRARRPSESSSTPRWRGRSPGGMASSDKRTVRDTDVAGKTVLVRVDYNVPLRPGTSEISDDSRIAASLPTVRYLVDRKCRIVLCSHLGRPGGEVVDDLRLAPVAERLAELLGREVGYARDCVGPDVERAVKALPAGGVLLLENLRFHGKEESNDADFSRSLASLADLYVNDAFGAAHRAHASTVGVAEHLPAVAGLLMARELQMLGAVLESPARPFAAVFGGAKVSDKLAVLQRMAPEVDALMVGGGMAATFLVARGLDVGTSGTASRTSGSRPLVSCWSGSTSCCPSIVVVAGRLLRGRVPPRRSDAASIPAGWGIMDIGPKTAAAFEAALESARTVAWNGTMGVAEWSGARSQPGLRGWPTR